MKTIFVCLLLGLSASISSYAVELTPRIGTQHLGVSLAGIAYPDTLAKDLMSGLENRLLIRVAVLSPERLIDSRDVSITIKYDLWEESFNLKQFVGDTLINQSTFKQTQGVMSYLANLQLLTLFPLGIFSKSQEVALRVEVLANPIEREKIEQLRKWVAANSAPGGAVGVSGNAVPLTSKPNDLFNMIFEQYIQGEDIAAPWKVVITSKSFKLDGATNVSGR